MLTPIKASRLPEDQPILAKPLVPTVVFGSWKGGVWKTSLSVSTAERLAWAGLRVLLFTLDNQNDARVRLGIPPSAAPLTPATRGNGSIAVLDAKMQFAADILYRRGPEVLGKGCFDVVVVDTPPTVMGGALPGVTFVAITDGSDATRNLVTVLKKTPKNTKIILVKVQARPSDPWAEEAAIIAAQVDRKESKFIPNPIPPSAKIKEALDNKTSVWSLSRQGNTKIFLACVESLSHEIWRGVAGDKAFPAMPSSNKAIYIQGWDQDD